MIDMKNFLTSFGSAEEMFLSYAEGNFSAEEEQIFDQLLEDNPLLSRSFIDFGSSYSESSFDEISIPVEKDMQMIADYREHFDIDSILSAPRRFEFVEHLHSIEDLIVSFNGIGETAGGIGETAGSVGETAGSVGETAGSVGETAGSVGETAGSVGETAGSVGETAGSVGETAGSVGETAGSVGETTGSAAAIKGEKATGPMQVGEAPVDEYSAYVKQGYSDTCAINSQKIILDAFGKHYTEEQLRDQAIKHGLYREGYGTSLNDMGKLLSLNDCPCTNYIGGNVADLTKALAEGKMVMMAVDSGELWKEGFLGRLWEKLEDKIPFIGGPDHALLVTGIDASDPEHVMVVVTDPGSGDLNKPYPIEQFIDAAKDSHFFMTVTDNPKPNVFEAYQNPSMTHLPQIGDLNYHRFVENYGQYFTLGNSVGELLPNNISEELVSSVYGEEIEEQGDSTNPVNDVDENGREDDAEKVTEEENGNNVPDTHHEFKDENEDGETKSEEEELAEGEENDHKGSEEDDENDHKDSGEEGEKEEGEEGDDQEGEDDEIDEYEN